MSQVMLVDEMLQSSSSEGVRGKNPCRVGLRGICTSMTLEDEAAEPEQFHGNQICKHTASHGL